MTWDLAGNLVAEVDPKLRAAGQEIAYSYHFEQLVEIDYPDDTGDVSYVYGAMGAPGNGAGRVVALEDGTRIQSLAYDALGGLASETTTMKVHNLSPETEAKLTFTTEFTYDDFGRLVTLTYPDGEVATHDYDSGGLLKSLHGTKDGFDYAYMNRLEYDEFLTRRFQETGNGVQTDYGFDAATRRLARQLTNTPDREVQDLNYTYDRVGNVLRLQNTVPDPQSSLMGGPSTQNYRYDAYYRLISADGTFAFAPGKRRDYTFAITYDAHGNVTYQKQTDFVFNQPGKKGLEQKPTTYELKPIAYGSPKPHAITKVGARPYTAVIYG
jgi:YD repeat-containing protein